MMEEEKKKLEKQTNAENKFNANYYRSQAHFEEDAEEISGETKDSLQFR